MRELSDVEVSTGELRIFPQGDRLLIRYLDPRMVRRAGSEIIATANDQDVNGKPVRAIVIAVGPGKLLDVPLTFPSHTMDGERPPVVIWNRPMPYQPGDTVLVERFRGNEVLIGTVIHMLIEEKYILTTYLDDA